MKFRIHQRGRLSTAPLACALAMAAPLAHAQVQATASLSNLNVKVMDLNTADKVKPSATWGGALSVPADASTLPIGAVTGTSTGTLPQLPFSTGTYGRNQISLSTTLGDAALAQATTLPGVYISNDTYESQGRAINPDTGLMTNYVDRIDSRYTSVYTTLGQSVASGFQNEGSDAPIITLTLAPGTLAIVSGNVLASVSTDSRWLTSFGQAVGLNTALVDQWGSLSGDVRANIDLVLENITVVSNPNGGSSTSNNNEVFNASVGEAFNTAGVTARDTSGLTDVQRVTSTANPSFSMVAQNWGTQEMVFVLHMQLGAAVTLDGLERQYTTQRVWNLDSGTPVDVVPPPVPNIPEPGTWMMMGLGLGGVAWACRRRSSQQEA